MSADRPIDKLLRLANILESGIGGQDGTWLARVIRDYASSAPRGMTFDKAAGLVPLPFCAAWWAEDRTALLAEAAALLAPGLPAKAQARRIEAAARRYASAARADNPPTEPTAAVFWRLAHCGSRWPIGERSIFNDLTVKNRGLSFSPLDRDSQPTTTRKV